jgi:hypothetical protein
VEPDRSSVNGQGAVASAHIHGRTTRARRNPQKQPGLLSSRHGHRRTFASSSQIGRGREAHRLSGLLALGSSGQTRLDIDAVLTPDIRGAVRTRVDYLLNPGAAPRSRNARQIERTWSKMPGWPGGTGMA